MPGINLAQSVAQQQEGIAARGKKAFRGGMIFVIVLVALVLAGWGGLRFQFKKAETEIAALEMKIQEKSQSFSSESVDRVADMQNRIDLIEKVSKNGAVPFDLLRAIEKVVTSETMLTRYAYDFEANSISIDAETDSYKTLIAQLALFRSLPDFQGFSIDSISKTEAGVIHFEVTIQLASKLSTE